MANGCRLGRFDSVDHFGLYWFSQLEVFNQQIGLVVPFQRRSLLPEQRLSSLGGGRQQTELGGRLLAGTRHLRIVHLLHLCQPNIMIIIYKSI